MVCSCYFEAMTFIIKDLHCDLLEYLQQGKGHSATALEARCSVSQLEKGGVETQVLAIFTPTIFGSHFSGRRQVLAYQKLKLEHTSINWRLAIENGSAFFEEDEPLKEGMSRIRRWHKECGPFTYLSLTWNSANRFGGGSLEPTGLKKDGEHLLELMAELMIPLDLAHASDPLAEQALDCIDRKGLVLPVLYSHGEMRGVRDVPRNIPDWLLQEVIERQGIVGLSFVRSFIGERSNDLCSHVAYALEKGSGPHLCFGADFFFENSIPEDLRRKEPYFFQEWSDASCYPKVMQLLEKELHLDRSVLLGLASENVERFFKFVDKLSKEL